MFPQGLIMYEYVSVFVKLVDTGCKMLCSWRIGNGPVDLLISRSRSPKSWHLNQEPGLSALRQAASRVQICNSQKTTTCLDSRSPRDIY